MMLSGNTKLCVVACATVALLAVAPPVPALDYFVGTTADTNDGLCTPVGAPIQETCSLREAVIEANTVPGTDTIYLEPKTYHLTINGPGEDQAATGDLDIHEDVHIVGSGMFATRITGFSNDPIFESIFATTPPFPLIQIYDLELSEALRGVDAVKADVYLWRVTVSRCSNVGVRVSDGTLLVVDSVLRDMEASYAAMQIVDGDLFVSQSTIANNAISSLYGAVGCLNSNVSLVNSTISGNSASGGQPVFAGFHGTGCASSFDSCTVIENEPYELAVSTGDPGTTTLRNNYVFGSCPSTNTGLIVSQGGNVASSTTADTYCGLNDPNDRIVPGGPLVMPLGYFGGYAPTRLPRYVDPNHPLVDNPIADAHCQAADQRGVARPQDGGGSVVACDVGAVERRPGDYTQYWGDGFESGNTSNWSQTTP